MLDPHHVVRSCKWYVRAHREWSILIMIAMAINPVKLLQCRIRIAFLEVPTYSSSFNLVKTRKKYLRSINHRRNFFCFSSYSNHFGPVVESHVIFSILTISLELRSHQGLLNDAERRNIHPSSPPRISTKMSIIMAFSVNLYRVVLLWIVSIFYLDSIHQYSWRCATMGLFSRKK